MTENTTAPAGPALVIIPIDPREPQGAEGFVRVPYSVNESIGPSQWKKGPPRTLRAKVGDRYILGAVARKPDLKLASVVSLYRAPGDAFRGPESPFEGDNPRRMDDTLRVTARLATKGRTLILNQKTGLYFYPIIDSETFRNGGNYFYTVCLWLIGTRDPAKFFVCDPEMEIGP